MNKQIINWWIRKSHRYLGIVLGIQFVLWTVSGVFFAWTNITEIRGDHLRKKAPPIRIADEMVSPTDVRESLAALDKDSELTSFRLVSVFDKPFYEAVYRDSAKKSKTILFDAVNGEKRGAVSSEEAVIIAKNAMKRPQQVEDVVLLTESDVGSHHEIRGQPLPAWAVNFEKPENLTVYVSAESGQVIRFRTRNWRVFDFLWMLHTMDFIGRDDVNNWALRIFSGLGMLMLASGFAYFFITFKKPWG